MSSINDVWRRIAGRQGEVFRQVRGASFTYRLDGAVLVPDRTDYGLGKSQFARAIERVPLPNTAAARDLRGRSYIFAILMDPRIRAGEW